MIDIISINDLISFKKNLVPIDVESNDIICNITIRQKKKLIYLLYIK